MNQYHSQNHLSEVFKCRHVSWFIMKPSESPAHLGRQRCCRTWFVLRGPGKALHRSEAACRCGYDRGNRDRKWMSTGSRGSTRPRRHPLQRKHDGEAVYHMHRLLNKETAYDSLVQPLFHGLKYQLHTLFIPCRFNNRAVGNSPGQTAVLLQGRFSRRGPVHWVVMEAVAQMRVRLCHPSPQVMEHVLQEDHSSVLAAVVYGTVQYTSTAVTV